MNWAELVKQRVKKKKTNKKTKQKTTPSLSSDSRTETLGYVKLKWKQNLVNPDVFKLVSCSSTLATHVFHYAHFEFDLSNTLAAKDWGKKKNKQKKESARGMSWSRTRVGMKRSFLLESQRFTFSKNCIVYRLRQSGDVSACKGQGQT